MAYNEQRTQQVRELLADIPDVRERKMFGSIGFIVHGKLCIGVGDHADHAMMVRVGPKHYAQALARKGAHPAIMRGREYKGYIFLTDDAVTTQDDIAYWVNLALDFNKTMTTS